MILIPARNMPVKTGIAPAGIRQSNNQLAGHVKLHQPRFGGDSSKLRRCGLCKFRHLGVGKVFDRTANKLHLSAYCGMPQSASGEHRRDRVKHDHSRQIRPQTAYQLLDETLDELRFGEKKSAG